MPQVNLWEIYLEKMNATENETSLLIPRANGITAMDVEETKGQRGRWFTVETRGFVEGQIETLSFSKFVRGKVLPDGKLQDECLQVLEIEMPAQQMLRDVSENAWPISINYRVAKKGTHNGGHQKGYEPE